jgi:hypothetical protein
VRVAYLCGWRGPRQLTSVPYRRVTSREPHFEKRNEITPAINSIFLNNRTTVLLDQKRIL